MNLGDIIRRITNVVAGDTYIVGNQQQLIDWANDAVIKMRSYVPETDDQVAFNTVVNQVEYNLPDDFIRAKIVTYQSAPLEFMPYSEVLIQQADDDIGVTQLTYGFPEWFYLRSLTNSNTSTALGGNPIGTITNLSGTALAGGTTTTLVVATTAGVVPGNLITFSTGTGSSLNNGKTANVVSTTATVITFSADIPAAPDNNTFVITNATIPARNIIGFYPIPNDVQPVQITYSKRPPILLNLTDIPAFPDEFHEAIYFYVLSIANEMDKEFQIAEYYQNKWQKELSRFRVYQMSLKPVYGTYIRDTQ